MVGTGVVVVSVVVVVVGVVVVGVVVVGVVVVGVVVVGVVVVGVVVVGMPHIGGHTTNEAWLHTHRPTSKAVPGGQLMVAARIPSADCWKVVQEVSEFGSYMFPFSSQVQSM